MKTLYISAAIVALAGAATAQEAFIQQVGDDNQAANLSFNSDTDDANNQVIYQEGDSQLAVNYSDGEGNQAWAYQLAVDAPGIFGGFGGGANVEHTSLVVQEGDDNTAINVALDQNTGFFDPGTGATQQTLQSGDNNTALNWSQDSNANNNIIGTVGIPPASINITPLTAPSFGGTVSGSIGTISIN